MYHAIIFLIFFELFLSYFLEHIIKLLDNHKLICDEKNQKINSEIFQLEEELKELNKPSTFIEYVKKSRKLNILKQTLNNGATQEINQTCNKDFNFIKRILGGIYLILKIVNLLPPKIRQFLAFHIVKLYVNKQSIIIPFNQKLYSPFFQSKEKANNINSLLSYGVICTLTDLIKVLIKHSLHFNITYLQIIFSKSM
ncbi:uncharacterized protein ELE39_002331 [Cryptosporidium sp. chipmunk genotype I]|uniref:uncharacterized protein n=1 Tax=Cryptosporidium sp. chipmunk genotype I TaxID=1280935 RepID=UPI00351A2A8E|nr:hypothetical protein ELE39_002331 [Cryptosporidium sp. chipmunk genotype I]